MTRVVVVGASAGGIATAEALRRSGYGGALTLVGDEVGPPYDRPPLSKRLLGGRWTPEDLALRTADALKALDLDLRLGRTATGLDPDRRTVTLSDGVALDYDTARQLLVAYRRDETLTGVLAVGASPRTLRAWRALIAARTPWATPLPT